MSSNSSHHREMSSKQGHIHPSQSKLVSRLRLSSLLRVWLLSLSHFLHSKLEIVVQICRQFYRFVDPNRRSRDMKISAQAFAVWALISVHFIAAAEVTPAFVWSDLRCLGEQDRIINYESQTPESLVDFVFHDFGKCAASQDLSREVANPEMIIAFIGKELRSEGVSRSYSSDVLKILQSSVARAKFSLSVPFVTVASNKPSVAESLLSNIQTKLGPAVKIGQIAVSGACPIRRHNAKRLTDVPDIEAYIAERKPSRAKDETDILLICYSPTLDWGLASVYSSEGKVLKEVLSSLKTSGTSHVAMYSSDPLASTEKHYGIMERHLLDGTGNATTDCDALCRSRAVILEGIFVAFTLLTILVSGICCMKAITSPSRFEVSKDQ